MIFSTPSRVQWRNIKCQTLIHVVDKRRANLVHQYGKFSIVVRTEIAISKNITLERIVTILHVEVEGKSLTKTSTFITSERPLS